MKTGFFLLFIFLIAGCVPGDEASSDGEAPNSPGEARRNGPSEGQVINTAPIISDIPTQTTEVGEPIIGIPVQFDEGGPSIEDRQSLSIFVGTSNNLIIPAASVTVNFVDNGVADASAVAATIDIYPLSGTFGDVTITLTVLDTGGPSLSTNATFTVKVKNPIQSAGLSPLAWYKGSAGTFNASASYAQNGESIVVWEDQSGNGNRVTTTATATPVLVSSDANFNNKGSLFFDGLDDELSETTVALGNSGEDLGMSVFLVYLMDAAPFDESTFISYNGAAHFKALRYHQGADRLEYRYNDGTTNASLSSTAAIAVTSQLQSFIDTGREVSFYEKGNFDGYSPLNLNTVAFTDFYIGSTQTASNTFMKGHIAEIIIFTGDLSHSSRQLVEAYLGQKYNFQIPPTNNLALHLAADGGVTSDTCGGTAAVNGGDVACWSDQSGNASDTLSVTGGVTYVATNEDLNDKPSVSFSGTGRLIQGTQASDWNFLHDGSDHEEFVVFKANDTSPSTEFVLLDTGQLNANNSGYTFSIDDSGVLGRRASVASNIFNATGTLPYDNNTINDRLDFSNWQLVSHQYNSQGAGLIHANGVEESSFVTTSLTTFSTADATGPLALAATTTPIGVDSSFQGDMAEVLIYNASLTESDRNKVEKSLQVKYELGLTAPTVLSIPGLRLWLAADKGVVGTRYNWIQRSEELDNATWTASGGVFISADTTQDPRQINTNADRFRDTLAGGSCDAICQPLDQTIDGGVYTLSAYLSPQTSTTAALSIYDVTATAFRAQADFSITAGVVSVATENVGTASAVDAGNGYYRISVTTGVGTLVSGNNNQVCIHATSCSETPGAVVANDFWGAQVNQASITADYLTTTTASTSAQGGTGAQVTYWADQSPYANDASQTSFYQQPVLDLSKINGKPAIKLDGVDDVLGGNEIQLSHGTLFVVLISEDMRANVNIFGNANSLGNATNFALDLDSGQYILDGWDGDRGLTAGPLTAGSANIVMGLFRNSLGETEKLLVENGNFLTSISTTAGDGILDTDSTYYRVGVTAEGGGRVSLNGWVAEIILFSDPIDTGQRLAVQCYLSEKYDIFSLGCN